MSAPIRVDDSLGACLSEAAHRLAEAGVEAPRREARLLMAHCLGCDPATLLGPQGGRHGEYGPFRDLVARRARREPLSHLLGRRGFWSLDFDVGPDVLDPRPDSEVIVEAVLRAFPEEDAAFRLLDFGTGSGCLALSLLAERPNAGAVAVDVSRAALAVAAGNAHRLGLARRIDFVESDWGAALTGRFEVIVANPPYIPSAEIDALAPEVALYEPRLALDGGADGLDAYRALAGDIARLLAPGGKAFCEIGDGQADAVEGVLRGCGLEPASRLSDLAGRARCIVAQAH
jgi:release factor glutamine methyltransferase